jgi:hypothetical protein
LTIFLLAETSKGGEESQVVTSEGQEGTQEGQAEGQTEGQAEEGTFTCIWIYYILWLEI